MFDSAIVIFSAKKQNKKFVALSENVMYKEEISCSSKRSVHSNRMRLNAMIIAQHNKCINMITLNKLLDSYAKLYQRAKVSNEINI